MATLIQMRQLMRAAWDDRPTGIRQALLDQDIETFAGFANNQFGIKVEDDQADDLQNAGLLGALTVLENNNVNAEADVVPGVRDIWIDGATIIAYGCQAGYPSRGGQTPISPKLTCELGEEGGLTVQWCAGNVVASAIYGALQLRNVDTDQQAALLHSVELLLRCAMSVEDHDSDQYMQLTRMVTYLAV